MALVESAVGVPLMTPVEVFSVRPAGSAGETEYETTAPPLLVGMLLVIAVSLVYVAGLLEYLSAEGAISLTVMLTEAVVEPPVLVAVMV